MSHKCSCEDIEEKLCLLDYTQSVPQDLQKHLESCPSCRAEYEKQKRLYEMIRHTAPDIPALSDTVMKRIREEKIEIEKPAAKRFRLPLGTVAAAVAVLAVYVSVYSSKLPIALFRDDAKTEADSNEHAVMFLAKSADGTESVNGAKSGNDPETAGEAEFEAATDDAAGIEFFVADSASYGSGADGQIADTSDESDMIADMKKQKSDEGFSNGFMPNFSMTLHSVSDGNAEQNADTDSGNNLCTGVRRIAADGSNTASNGGGSTYENGTAANTLDPSILAQAQFESLSEQYPDRIDREMFESVGNECYLAFIDSVTNFDTEYTAENLQSFAESYSE